MTDVIASFHSRAQPPKRMRLALRAVPARALRRSCVRTRDQDDAPHLSPREFARRAAAPTLLEDTPFSAAARSYYTMCLPRYAGSF